MLNILLTNDDGYQADGIRAMGAALTGAGHSVTMLAPSDNRSCTSHRITVRETLVVEEHGEVDGVRVHSCSGTPADCVRVGVLGGLFARPDIVVSGINHGVNLGDDVRYSGTVSAAAEAAVLGVPAVALSQQGDDPTIRFLAERPSRFEHLDVLSELVAWFAEAGPEASLLNVNVPSGRAQTRVQWSLVGQRRWREVTMSVERSDTGAAMVQSWQSDPRAIFAAGSDFAAVAEGAVAVSLLSVLGGLVDVTDPAAGDLAQPHGVVVHPLAR
ncbi:5'/3'-nucleotidase SurE [Mycobacterium sp. ACS4331]|uniref:5'/3'-nucleotidase SurE n=1 Tax=Mycobacterium sp. ACS4331 TaxID=1834121 RepID=UPI0007FCFDC6|nr:5'/3'-nucleotidase SurE [Mycobacterium sp. ACS4331]OBF20968.1 5'/3'-nucleotidase SurE [Mycobacterium sp. ACS4331]